MIASIVLAAVTTLTPAHKPVGPYSQARLTRDFVFVAGQGPLDPKTHKLITGSFDAQARATFANLGAVLKEDGLTYKDIVKVTVYVTDMRNFGELNKVFADVFKGSPPPARTTVGVASLPLGAAIVIDAIAERH